MSSVAYKFRIEGQDVFTALAQKLVSIDIDEIKKSIGQELVEVSGEHIENKVSPDGQPFKAWAPATKKQAAGTSRDILRKDSNLFNSLAWQIVGNALYYGSDMVYAGVHQFGWGERNIPARPYLGIGMNEENRINDVLESFMGELD